MGAPQSLSFSTELYMSSRKPGVMSYAFMSSTMVGLSA